MIIRDKKGKFTKGNKSPKQFIKGQVSLRKGVKLSEDTKEKLRIANIGKKLSEETKKKISVASSGNKNGNWKGGIAKTYTLQKLELMAGRHKPEKCELCGRDGRICYDHDHATNKFRGWICHKCNATLGFIDDNIQTLELMIQYLKNSK